MWQPRPAAVRLVGHGAPERRPVAPAARLGFHDAPRVRPQTHVELHGAVAVLMLDDAATRNALGPTLRDELATAVLRVRDEEAIRAVVLTGANNQFCSGGDLRNIASAGGQGGCAS